MSQIFRTARFPALLSLGLLLPFLLIHAANRSQENAPMPYGMFALLFLLQLAFLLLLKPVLQGALAGRITSRPGLLVMCAACLALITLVWVRLMANPPGCFLGIAPCD
jgi:hypothetical protein